MTPTADRIAPQSRIGDYLVEREVPADGITNDFEATHVVLPRRVLIKVLQPYLIGIRPVAVQLMREACILEAMHHSGVPRIYECGVTADRRPWTAVEIIGGPSLELETRERTLPPRDVIALIQQAAEVLAHAHSRGVVHRKIEPRAIVRDHADRRNFPLCIVGWGDARTLDTLTPQETLEQGQYYRAPELLCGDPFDGRADVFALGVVAYEALTGNLPSLPIARRCPTAPPQLTRLIDRMLSIDPAMRPSAFDVAEDAAAIIGIEVIAEKLAIVQPIEDIVLVNDLSRDGVPEPVRRSRWTPPWDLKDRAAAAREAAQPKTRRTRSMRDDT